MIMQPKTIRFSKYLECAVTFLRTYEAIDPRTTWRGNLNPQSVTVCILRPLTKGPRETFTGVAVCHPQECFSRRTGEAVALARAIQDLTGDDYRECYSRARRWFWEQDQEQQGAEFVAQLNTAAVEA